MATWGKVVRCQRSLLPLAVGAAPRSTALAAVSPCDGHRFAGTRGTPTKTNVREASTTTKESSLVGFIGLGKIGYAMAANMMASGQNLLVYDPVDTNVDRLVAAGAIRAGSAAQAAAGVTRVVTVLPNDAVLNDVTAEIVPAMPKGAVHVGCSTVSPHTSRTVAETHAAADQTFVAAPVFARPDGMAAKQATIPISGPAAAVARVTPLLDATSTAVVDFGEDPGAANVVKLGGNFLIAAAIESMAEALALAEANGVDRQKMMTLLNSTIFDCLIYKGYGQRVADRDHHPYLDAHFGLDLGLKDVTLVSDTAAASGVPMPVCSILKDRYLSAKARGWSELDWSAIGMAVSADAGAEQIRSVAAELLDKAKTPRKPS